jgi:hypothetical protein
MQSTLHVEHIMRDATIKPVGTLQHRAQHNTTQHNAAQACLQRYLHTVSLWRL